VSNPSVVNVPSSSRAGFGSILARVALALCGAAFVLLAAMFVFTSMRIGKDVQAVSTSAIQVYGGGSVEALIQFVDDERHSLRERNRAVWALGQLGDARALPVLRKHFDGAPCNHNVALCQRELDKALQLAGGGVNLTAFVWRRDPLR
jgi:hypothetical protein